jgi:tRNA threonylcarbamoyladenosine biosynthesis protein TsaE
MEISYLSRSEDDTKKLARVLASMLAPGDVVFLDGDLGMGKSVLARALVRRLTGIPDLDVPSPTFTLVQIYDTDLAPLWHFDLYRIKSPEEVWELGWEDALQDIILVEWPSRLGSGLAPANRLALGFEAIGDDRLITITPFGTWQKRWDQHGFEQALIQGSAD